MSSLASIAVTLDKPLHACLLRSLAPVPLSALLRRVAGPAAAPAVPPG